MKNNRISGEERTTERLLHGFGPIYDEYSRVLILGSFPSVQSRAENFYYGHPQNRFWKLLAGLWQEAVPDTVPAKKAFLLAKGLALYDAIESCVIKGSADSSIQDLRPADLSPVFSRAPIRAVFCNGAKAFATVQKYQIVKAKWQLPVYKLMSTSPANAQYSLARLIEEWQPLKNFLSS